MLSRAEQQRLREIEKLLRSQDPRFAQRFDNPTARGSQPRWHGRTASLWLIASVAIAIVSVLMNSGTLAVMALSAMGVTVAMWLTA